MNNCSKRNCPMNMSTFKECNITDGKCEYYTKTNSVDDVLTLLEEKYDAGSLEYSVYSELHDAISMISAEPKTWHRNNFI